MFRSLHSRLWLSNILLVGSVLCIVTFGVMVYLVRNPVALRQASMHLEVAANVLLRTENRIEAGDPSQYQKNLEIADHNLNARFILVDPQGNIVADSRLDEASIPANTINRIVNQTSLRIYPQFRDQNRKTWIYSSRILANGMTLVACNPKPGLTVAQFIRDDFFRLFIRTGLITLLLSIFLAWLTAQWISRPLESITHATQQASLGHFNQIPLEGPEEVQILAKSFNDMTNRVQASEKSQRDFIANVSHDLKTPLTSIQGFAQAILDGTADTPEAIHHASEVIHSEVTRMYHMVLGLLELARLDSGVAKMKKEKINLTYLLENLVTQFTLQAQQSGKVLLSEIAVLPEISGDSERLVQAVSNLLDNALKFSLSGGKVTLKAFSEKEQIEIHITDEGPGISQEDLPNIFDRFYRADKSRSNPVRGSGLGLSISREIVQAHGGSISVMNNYPTAQTEGLSQPPGGCTFMIKLPLPKLSPSTSHKSQ
jgi:signal transduction histidine kinase